MLEQKSLSKGLPTNVMGDQDTKAAFAECHIFAICFHQLSPLGANICGGKSSVTLQHVLIVF